MFKVAVAERKKTTKEEEENNEGWGMKRKWRKLFLVQVRRG